MSSEPDKDRTEVKQAAAPTGVLERGLHLMNCFSLESPRLQLREIALKSGLDKATTLRALKTLVAYNFLERNEEGYYWPGPANLRLAAIFRGTSNVVTRLERPIERIALETGQAAALFIRSGDQRVCLIRDRQRRDFRYFVDVGASVPMSAGGAAAHVLSAYSDFTLEPEKAEFVRENGYYISRGEKNKHLVSAAVPVFEADREFIGAAAITALRSAVSDEDIHAYISIVKREIASEMLSTELE